MEKKEEKKNCKSCIYSIKGGWQMLEEMRGMSNVKPRKGLLKEKDMNYIPHYFGFFPLDYYLPRYVEIGEIRTGVLAGPRGKKLVKLINKEIKKKGKGKEYVVIKQTSGYTLYFRIFVCKNL